MEVNSSKERQTIEDLKSVPPRNLEEEFEMIIDNLEINNPDINEKRSKLGKFQFTIRSSIEGLDLISNSTDENGEAYYGFM